MTYTNSNALHIPLADNTVQCVITSPPYYGLRDYGICGQLGLELTPALYVANLVSVFREVWRVLKDDGTVWLNIGDSYASEGKGNNNGRASSSLAGGWDTQESNPLKFSKMGDGAKRKDLLGIPWRVAFALQDDGWYLRSDIIWHKPNPMPESVTDRPTKAHEYVFLLTKSERYYYDNEAIKEQVAESTGPRLLRGVSDNHKNINGAPGQTAHTMNQPRVNSKYSFARTVSESPPPGQQNQHREDREDIEYSGTRNKRTVWTVATSPYSGAHFATFPPKLIEPMVLAGSRRGDLVLDPFMGSGTTAQVAIQHGRRAVGCELSMDYIKLAQCRTAELAVVML